MGALMGYVLGTSVSPYIHVEPVIIIAVAVVLGGMITFAVQKVVIICISAFFGSWIFLMGIGQLLSRVKTESLINEPGNVLLLYQKFTWMMLVWLVISMIGIYSQYRRMEKKKE